VRKQDQQVMVRFRPLMTQQMNRSDLKSRGEADQIEVV
jgi:hypothetical protein